MTCALIITVWFAVALFLGLILGRVLDAADPGDDQ